MHGMQNVNDNCASRENVDLGWEFTWYVRSEKPLSRDIHTGRQCNTRFEDSTKI